MAIEQCLEEDTKFARAPLMDLEPLKHSGRTLKILHRTVGGMPPINKASFVGDAD